MNFQKIKDGYMQILNMQCRIVALGVTLLFFVICHNPALAGNKKMMSVLAAKNQAARALIESVYGMKIRSKESVEDMVAASYKNITESKTQAFIKGIKYDSVVYDPKKDIAMVEASVRLPSIENIDGQKMELFNKVFRRTGYGTSTPSSARSIAALRAAEIDGYRELAKYLVGIQVEAKTSVENFVLSSDTLKTKLLATLYLAQITDHGWESNGDAFVNMELNLTEAEQILGRELGVPDEIIQVQGIGAQVDNFSNAKK